MRKDPSTSLGHVFHFDPVQLEQQFSLTIGPRCHLLCVYVVVG